MRNLLVAIIAIIAALSIIGNGHAESAYESCAVINPTNNGRMFVYRWNPAAYDYDKVTVTVTESMAGKFTAQCNDTSIRMHDGSVVPFTVEDVETPNSWELVNYHWTSGKDNGYPIDAQVMIGGVTYHLEFSAEHEDMLQSGDRVVISGSSTVLWYSGEYERMMVSDLIMTPVQTPTYTVALPMVAN